jgi:hypothetical protein
MGRRLSIWLAHLVVVLAFASGLAVSSASAQSDYAQQDLDAMLAPIALYPDELLTQVLIAATYPDDVADARHYMDRYPSLSGALLGYQVNAMPWDDSVKSLTQFPSLLAMLDDQPDWTDAIGYAFINQQTDVMQTIQRLRMRAQRAGYLQSNSQQVVDAQNNIIIIQPVRDGFYYVPYYDPTVVYGRWWWPNRQPYYWDPPSRYQPPGYSVASGIFFGASVGIINSIFYPVRPDWHHHHVIITGGNKPGGHWQWKPRPQRPGQPNRPVRPNRPPTTKPILKPRPPRPLPGKPGGPQIQPPRPGIPGKPGRPEIQPTRPGRPEVQPPKPQPPTPGQPGGPAIQPPRPGRPEGPRPERPVTLPGRPTAPVTRPTPVEPARPVIRPMPTQPVIRPVPTRPVVTPPVTRPVVQPVARPAPVQRPAVTRPAMPSAPVGRPAVQVPPKPEARPAPKQNRDQNSDDDDKKRRDQR